MGAKLMLSALLPQPGAARGASQRGSLSET